MKGKSKLKTASEETQDTLPGGLTPFVSHSNGFLSPGLSLIAVEKIYMPLYKYQLTKIENMQW